MVPLLRRQGPQEEGVAPGLILTLLAAVVGAPAAGRAVPGGVARLVGAPADAGVATRGPAAQTCAHHARAAVSGRGGRLGLDLQVLSGQEVEVGGLTQVPGTQDSSVKQERSQVDEIILCQGGILVATFYRKNKNKEYFQCKTLQNHDSGAANSASGKSRPSFMAAGSQRADT